MSGWTPGPELLQRAERFIHDGFATLEPPPKVVVDIRALLARIQGEP